MAALEWPSIRCTDLTLAPGAYREAGGRVPQLVRRQPVQAGGPGSAVEHVATEVQVPQHRALAARERQLLGGHLTPTGSAVGEHEHGKAVVPGCVRGVVDVSCEMREWLSGRKCCEQCSHDP